MIPTEFCTVMTTLPSSDDGADFATQLVQQGLAACVQMTSIVSVYQWEGKVERPSERLVMIKTKTALYPALEAAIRSMHPYETPEIIQLPITQGFAPYLDWMRASTRS